MWFLIMFLYSFLWLTGQSTKKYPQSQVIMYCRTLYQRFPTGAVNGEWKQTPKRQFPWESPGRGCPVLSSVFLETEISQAQKYTYLGIALTLAGLPIAWNFALISLIISLGMIQSSLVLLSSNGLYALSNSDFTQASVKGTTFNACG